MRDRTKKTNREIYQEAYDAYVDQLKEDGVLLYEYAEAGIGNRIAWTLPASDGSYELVLHFAEPSYAAGNRIFDDGFLDWFRENGRFDAITLRAIPEDVSISPAEQQPAWNRACYLYLLRNENIWGGPRESAAFEAGRRYCRHWW